MSDNKEYLENNIDDVSVERENEIEFIDYDIDSVKVDKSDDTLDFEEAEKKADVKEEIISWIKMIVIAVVAAFIINSFIIINATIPSGSMENTIMTGDRIIGLRLSYMFNAPKRGDVVVFKAPLDETKNYVKRIIGLPGETIKIIDSKVYVWDTEKDEAKEEIKEDYLKEEWVNRNDNITFVIPDNRYLMMGDNRNWSSDAREWQAMVEQNPDMDPDIIYVHEDKILGKAYFAYWSQNKISFKWIH